MYAIRRPGGALLLLICIALLAPGGASGRAQAAEGPDFPTIGTIERLDDRVDRILARDARMERLADGFDWSEGPVWLKDAATCSSPTSRRIQYSAGNRA